MGMFIILMFIFSMVLRRFFYDEARHVAKVRTNELVNVLSTYKINSDSEFKSMANFYTQNFNSEDVINLVILDEAGNAVATSDKNAGRNVDVHCDFEALKESKDNYDVWEGKLSDGERTLAITKCIYKSDKCIGGVRYITSLEEVNSKVVSSFFILLIVTLILVILMMYFEFRFVKSIVEPVKEICDKAKLIAQGDFHIKLNKKYDDEIGDLSDTINYMAQELDKAEKIKNEFISSVSHELRTPLTAIKGWAETMQLTEESDIETRKRGLDIIVKEAERLSWIVESLLDFSSIKEKRIKLVREKIDILAEIAEAVYMFKDRASNEKKTLIYNEPKNLPPVLGDRHRLRQVFINILDNALKYTSKGGGVSVNVCEKDNNIVISVTDNGCGIPAEHLPNVTQKFYKANYLQKGSGIGLAIVDEIVSLHGGELSIISEEGFGTTVMVSLPVMEDENSNLEQQENSVGDISDANPEENL